MHSDLYERQREEMPNIRMTKEPSNKKKGGNQSARTSKKRMKKVDRAKRKKSLRDKEIYNQRIQSVQNSTGSSMSRQHSFLE
jgi:hypothetical protein